MPEPGFTQIRHWLHGFLLKMLLEFCRGPLRLTNRSKRSISPGQSNIGWPDHGHEFSYPPYICGQ